jgi:hypothetical protein
MFDNNTSTCNSTSNCTRYNNHQDVSTSSMLTCQVMHEVEQQLHSDMTPLTVENCSGEDTSRKYNTESSDEIDFYIDGSDQPHHHHEMNDLIENHRKDDENALINKNEIAAVLCGIAGNTHIV